MAVKFDPTKEVRSLELCERLKELGYPQNGGGWYWVIFDKGTDLDLLYPKGSLRRRLKDWLKDFFVLIEEIGGKEIIKAPTIRELSEWLPISIKEGKSFLNINKPSPNTWIVGYTESRSWRVNAVAYDGDTEANVRAKMIIWLAENGYVKFKEVKQ